MIRVTQVPAGPVRMKQRFTVLGVASPEYAGKSLSLTVDNQYKTTGPIIQPDGSWRVDFLFQQAGNRLLRIGIERESVDVVIQVVTDAPPPTPRLTFTGVPPSVHVEQVFTLQGKAVGYVDGSQLLLRADQRYQLARPVVRNGQWEATLLLTQPGQRIIEIVGTGQDRAQITLDVKAAAPPIPRPPRVSFTNVPTTVQAEQVFLLQGGAENYKDGDQLVLRADQQYILGRPLVKDSKWQATILFHQEGKRVIEIIGSEQDRAQITLDVRPAPPPLSIQARNTWTSIPSPSDLPNLTPLRITLHHTYISPTLAVGSTQTQEVERMRAIWNSHVRGNGWSDIGYHYIIMPSGRIYEARSEHKRGAHDVINDGLGIAFDGVYTNATISAQQYQSAVILCAVLCKRYGITDPVTPVPTPTADFGTRSLPRILGHRDRVSTECPGADGGRTVRLPEIRQAVKTQL